MIVLLHSSKTMRDTSVAGAKVPPLLPLAKQIDAYLKTLSVQELAQSMHLSRLDWMTIAGTPARAQRAGTPSR